MMIDPESVDWTEHDDLEVVLAAHAGIAPAITEAKRRGLSY